MEIKNRFTGKIIYENENIYSLKGLLMGADLSDVDLSGVNLSYANLSKDGRGGDVIKGFTPQIEDTTIIITEFTNTNFGLLNLSNLESLGMQK